MHHAAQLLKSLFSSLVPSFGALYLRMDAGWTHAYHRTLAILLLRCSPSPKEIMYMGPSGHLPEIAVSRLGRRKL